MLLAVALYIASAGVPAPEAAVWEAMVARFASHSENPYHWSGERYSAPLRWFGSFASRTNQVMGAEELARLVPDKEVRVSVLLLAGACNTWIGAPLQMGHREMFSAACLQAIDDVGHAMSQDNKTQTLGANREFLAE